MPGNAQKLEKIFKPGDVRDYAEARLGLNVEIREYEKWGKAFLHVTIYTPQGARLKGREEEAMNFEINGELTGNKQTVIHYLCTWVAVCLAKLAPQIKAGEITTEPVLSKA